MTTPAVLSPNSFELLRLPDAQFVALPYAKVIQACIVGNTAFLIRYKKLGGKLETPYLKNGREFQTVDIAAEFGQLATLQWLTNAAGGGLELCLNQARAVFTPFRLGNLQIIDWFLSAPEMHQQILAHFSLLGKKFEEEAFGSICAARKSAAQAESLIYVLYSLPARDLEAFFDFAHRQCFNRYGSLEASVPACVREVCYAKTATAATDSQHNALHYRSMYALYVLLRQLRSTRDDWIAAFQQKAVVAAYASGFIQSTEELLDVLQKTRRQTSAAASRI